MKTPLDDLEPEYDFSQGMRGKYVSRLVDGAMSNNSDPLFDRYASMDFGDARPVATVPALARLQAGHGGTSHVNMRLDNDELSIFKARAIRVRRKE